jgi:hypothetical protein
MYHRHAPVPDDVDGDGEDVVGGEGDAEAAALKEALVVALTEALAATLALASALAVALAVTLHVPLVAMLALALAEAVAAELADADADGEANRWQHTDAEKDAGWSCSLNVLWLTCMKSELPEPFSGWPAAQKLAWFARKYDGDAPDLQRQPWYAFC